MSRTCVERARNATNLWSYKISRIAGCHQKPVLRAQLLREPKITDTQTSRGTSVVSIENIGRLQISVDHLQAAEPHVGRQYVYALRRGAIEA